MKKKGWSTVENSQVTIALQAHGLTGPVGTPILLASLVLDGGVQQLVLLKSDHLGLREVGRYERPRGPLASNDADFFVSVAGDVIYERLLAFVGVQPVLPTPAE